MRYDWARNDLDREEVREPAATATLLADRRTRRTSMIRALDEPHLKRSAGPVPQGVHAMFELKV
jgi:hypothetical protein